MFKKDFKNLTLPLKIFPCYYIVLIIFFKDFNYLFLKKGGGREGEKHWFVASHTPPTGGLAHNPGMCPDGESNWWTLGLWDNAQPTEPYQSGQ